MPYTIEFKTKVEKDLKNIDRKFIDNILSKIETLSQNPYPPNSKKIINTSMSYRIRIGDYRAIYQVDEDKKLITVYHIRHRKDAYK